MDTATQRPTLHDPPTGAVDAENSLPSEPKSERGMTCGMGRSGGFMTMAAIAAAVVVVAGLSFQSSGWLTASSLISLVFLLPCLAMCVGMIWMMMRGGNDQSSDVPDRDQRP